MRDLIDRQAAIGKVKKLCEGCYLSEHCGKCLAKCLVRKAVKILEKVSSVQRWIPCSRELPKKDGDYLVTTHSGQIARYIFIGGSSEEYWRRCATAWMPLPTPYREGGQDGKN